jgi:hypothetical protein
VVDLHTSGEKQCSYCAETIKTAAIKCRFCQSDLSGDAGGTPPVDAPPPPSSEPAVPSAYDVEPDREDSADVVPAPTSTWRSPSERGRTSLLDGRRLFAALLVLCLLLAGLAGYAWWALDHPDENRAGANAITSSQTRDAGLAASTQLTEKVLTYDWKTLDADMKAAEAVLAPTFRAEYSKAMTGVKAQTVENQVKLTAKVVAASIISASPTKVQALVFVNQTTTAKGSANQRLDQNRVRVTLTRDGGDWRVSKMDAF